MRNKKINKIILTQDEVMKRNLRRSSSDFIKEHFHPNKQQQQQKIQIIVCTIY